MEAFGPKNVVAFTKALRERLLGQNRTFGKRYLKLLVEEVRYQDKRLVMKGSYAAVGRSVGEGQLGTPGNKVPCFSMDWLPGQDSNLRPAGYKTPNLSAGLGLSLHPPALIRGGCRALARPYWFGSSASSLCTFLPTSVPFGRLRSGFPYRFPRRRLP